jgi:hypothetical protein
MIWALIEWHNSPHACPKTKDQTIFVFIKWGSLAISAGANPMNFRLIWSLCMHSPSSSWLINIPDLCRPRRDARNCRLESWGVLAFRRHWTSCWRAACRSKSEIVLMLLERAGTEASMPLGVNFAPWDQSSPLGGAFTPSLTPKGNSLYC